MSGVMGFDRKEIIAVLIVFIATFGALQFPAKSTLPDFAVAMQLSSALALKAAPFHMQVAALKEQAYSAAFGLLASSPGSIVSFLLLFSPLLLSASSVFLYLSIRSLGFGRAVSAFGALLFSFSLSSLSFLPGMYGAAQAATPIFALFLLLLCNLHRKAWLFVPAALFAALAAYASAAFGVAAIAAALAFAAPAYGKEKGRLAQAVVIIIAAAAGTLLSQDAYLHFTLASAQASAPLLAFLVAPASCAAVLYFSARETIRDFLLFLFGLLIAVLSPTAGGMLLAVAASAGMARALGQKASKPLMLSCAFSIVFFSSAGLVLLGGANYYQALVAAILISALSPLLLHFYDYRSAHLFSAAALGLAVLSLFVLAFSSLSPQIYPQYADRDISAALSSLSGKGVSQVCMIGGQEAASFYLPAALQEKQADARSYFASGKPVPKPGAYVLFSLSDLDSWQGEGFSSYAFAANVTTQNGQAALFISPSTGLMLARDIGPGGSLALQDGALLDPYGRNYAAAPLSRMVFLQQSAPFDSAQNRLVVLDEGEPLPYFVKMFSGQASSIGEVSKFGGVTVFKVK